jgi:superfamily II DNA or RNA helicase
LFADLISQFANAGLRVLVLAHRDEIVQQISGALSELGVRHGIIAPGCPKTSDLVQVASVFSAVRRLQRLQTPKLIVIDEAHHAVAETWQRIIAAFPDSNILGVTATPRRLDGKPLDDVFEELIVGPSIAKLIDAGFLAPAKVFAPAHTPNLKKVRIRAGDYAVDELREVMSRGVIIDGAVDEYERICPDAPAIAFCVDIAHSKLVANAFAERGYRADHVDGDTPLQRRRDLIAALANGDLDVLSNCGLISEGLDVPGVVAAILLRPTESLALYLQMVGRALRPADGKDMAYILDHAGNVYRHGLPSAHRRWTLRGRAPQQQTDLIRCPDCGAMNVCEATECEHCGARLHSHRARAPRIEVPARRLVEAVEEPTSDIELRVMGLRAQFRWAAGDNERLMRSRLGRLSSTTILTMSQRHSPTAAARAAGLHKFIEIDHVSPGLIRPLAEGAGGLHKRITVRADHPKDAA